MGKKNVSHYIYSVKMSRPQTEQYKQFLKHKNHFIKKLGKKALFDNQLTIEGKALFGNKYLGTFSQNNIPLNKTGYLIANVDTVGMPGHTGLPCTPHQTHSTFMIHLAVKPLIYYLYLSTN